MLSFWLFLRGDQFVQENVKTVYTQKLGNSFGNDIESKLSLRAKRGNLLEESTFLLMRLLHSVRNYIQKVLLNY